MRIKLCVLILFVTFLQNSFSQNFSKIFCNLDFKDKLWIISKPNSSLTAKKISKQVTDLTDKISKSDFVNSQLTEQEIDAFRHISLMYKLSSQIGVEKARRFGNIYESYNKHIFFNKPNSGYDRAGEWMDKFNNEIGIYLYLKYGQISEEKLIQEIGYQIKKGNARMIKKDSIGNSLNVDNKIIDKEIWIKNWVNDRVLIQSNN